MALRARLLAALLCAAPLSVTSACATFEQFVPKSPREAYADAEIAFAGAVNVAIILAGRGVLSADELSALSTEFVRLSAALDTARTLLTAGEDLAAARSLVEITAALSRISLALSLKAEQPAQPQPAAPVAPVAFRTEV